MFVASLSWSQGLKAEGKVIVNANGEEVILRGLGPGGWQIMEGYMMNTSGVAGSQHEIKEKLIDLMGEEKTETFFVKWRENHFTKQDVDSLAAWGFNSIRIPMHYNLFTLPIEKEPVSGENTWIETGFDHIDDVLEWAEPYGIYVILDMHATPGGQGTGSDINDYDPSKFSLWESQENKDKLVALWTRIADRYKDNEWIGGYDLINETHWDLPGGTDLRNLFVDITDGIRSVDSNHTLFIEGNWYANDFSGLTPTWDDNMVYSFHKYWSYNDTASIQWVLDLREEHNVPLWMGESGENSNTWFTDAIKLFEDNGIGWAWWTMRKIGDIDSPYAVDINPGYQKILDYWNGVGPKPTAQETFDGMMQLAENLLVENSSFRKDVPDAIIRQVQTDETIPYTDHEIPGVVHMADFDLGKNGFAYYDSDIADYHLNTGEFQAWNSGWAYRNDGVDIEKNEDDINSNGFHVGFVNKGEWTKYTVQINEAGVYRAKVRLATQDSGGEFYLSIDDQEITTTQVVSSTGGWSNFSTVEVPDIILNGGQRGLKIHFSNDKAFNISSIEFEKTGEIDELELNALNGKTGEDEKSVEITISESIFSASLDGSMDQFTLVVNGVEKNITSVTASEDPLKDRSFILSIDEYLIIGDEIKVSYNGTSLKSESNKTLNAFTDLIINNITKNRVIIPGRIEVEDYDYMIGLEEEETSDEGGGINFGYTDPGDYADYSILVPKTGTYGIDFRIAGYDLGSIGLYSVDENDVETELIVVTTIATGGWQTWETVSDNLFIEEGIHKLRMRILQGGFNFNWIEFGYPDTDGDGVLDDVDDCPDTPEGTLVNINGCPIFTLPASNYAIKIGSETCRASNNGSITIAVNENYNYTATLTSDNGTVSNTFTSETKFENLTAGSYNLCFTIDEEPYYEQCFTIIVVEPEELTVNASKGTASKLSVSLTGSDVYYVTLNNKTITTTASKIELNLKNGVNSLSVKTNLDCQGIYNETFSVNTKPMVYPNPVQNNMVFINTGNLNVAKAPIEIYSVTGQLLFSKVYQFKNRSIQIDVTNIPKGVFILKIVTEGNVFNYKIIK